MFGFLSIDPNPPKRLHIEVPFIAKPGEQWQTYVTDRNDRRIRIRLDGKLIHEFDCETGEEIKP